MIDLFLLSIAYSFILILMIEFNYKFKIKSLNQIQNIHEGDTSRLGGTMMIICLMIYFILKQDFVLLNIFLITSIAIIPGILEDFRKNINPILRLSLIIISCFFIVISLEKLPILDFPKFLSFCNNYYFKLIFFSLCLATLVNGQNIIDGTNGLSALCSLTNFGCLLFLGLMLGDKYLINTSITFILIIICFLFFNYPFGKIFLGDAGSYFLGFMSGYMVLFVYGKYPNLPTWSAAVILFYPCFEVIFSYVRKIYQKKSPFKPDNQHLHLKIYYLLQVGHKKSVLYNALVAPFLAIIWLTPLAVLPFIIVAPKFSFLAMVGVVIAYLFYYYSIPYPKKENT